MSVAHSSPLNPLTAQKGANPTDMSAADRLARLAFGEADLPEITQRRRYFRHTATH